MGDPILQTFDVSVRFGGVQALTSVSLHLPCGSITALIGPNGAGKTTLLGALSGMVGIQEGRILFAGEDITSAPAHTRAGRGMLRTFQNLEIPSSMSVIDTVRLGCHARFPIPMWHNLMATPRSRQVEKAIHRAAMEALDFVGLADMAHYPATTLSFGAQRAVELARALVGKPRLLLLDEPAAGLNTAETQSLAELIVRARDVFSLTVLVVEHDMDLVMSISDQVAVLCFGELMACGSPTQIQNDPRVIAAYLGGSA